MSRPRIEFAARVLADVREALSRPPASFTFDDLAAGLGSEFRRGGDGKRRLERVLYRMRRDGVLGPKVPGRPGVFVAGTEWGNGDALGAGVGLRDRVRALFEKEGGFLRMGEAKVALGLDDGAGERALCRELAAGPYLWGLPVRGYRRVWRLPDAERLRLPLPGKWLALDTRLEIKAAGGAWREPEIMAAVERRRRAVVVGVRWARENAGLNPAELVEAPDLATAFEQGLAKGQRQHLAGAGSQTLGDWWAETRAREGAGALAYAWEELEDRVMTGEPCLVDAMAADFWQALGRRLDIDPVALSRGWIVEPR